MTIEMSEAFSRRKMNLHEASCREEAVETALELIPSGARVGFGGSVTLEQTGILDLLRGREDIDLLDRTLVTTADGLHSLYLEMFSCDVFLTSANAITQSGQLVNVDGRGNRVAMIAYGPSRVIVIAGRNKITPDLDAAIERTRTVATPLNVKRIRELAAKSPIGSNVEITEDRIWGQVSVIERQMDPDRIHVILVDEDLGF